MTFLIICTYILFMLVLAGTFALLQKVVKDGDEDGAVALGFIFIFELIGLGLVFFNGMKEMIK